MDEDLFFPRTTGELIAFLKLTNPDTPIRVFGCSDYGWVPVEIFQEDGTVYIADAQR